MTLVNIPVLTNAINIRFIIKFHTLSAGRLKASPETAAEEKANETSLFSIFEHGTTRRAGRILRTRRHGLNILVRHKHTERFS